MSPVNKKTIFIFLASLLILIFLFSGYRYYGASGAGCIACHGNAQKMKALGYPQFYVTQELARQETKHSRVKCQDCHLGDGRTKELQQAHKGMLKPLFLSEAGVVLERMKVAPGPLLPTGDDRLRELLPPASGKGPEVRNILWHDRNPETLNFDPALAEKTCGRADCHPKELRQFRTTVMGSNFRQRTMKSWIKPYGPHNCGPSFADIEPQALLNKTGFDFKNHGEIKKNLNTAFSREQAIAKQKFCNVCHAGCLDCHYSPNRERGVHSFVKKPTAETCSGNGRGMSMCHPGAMNSRRGESYIGGDYSVPSGMQADVHYKNNIQCIDCHRTGEKGMGDIQRKAVCQGCHVKIEEAHKEGVHNKLVCAACHINELGGYQITVWGPGYVAEKQNPFKKYSLYYGVQRPPIVMKDQTGMWMPVKVWPHSVGNIKDYVKPSEKVMFRWPGGETKDAYYILGTFDGLPGNNKHLLWLEIEQAAHSYGKARDCDSCHKSGTQLSVSTWTFEDNQGAEPFSGTHRIVADKKSLRIEGLKNTMPINLFKGSKLEDFASWVYLRDKWKAPGDFSIRADRGKYKSSQHLFRENEDALKTIEARLTGSDTNTQKLFKDLRGAVSHNMEGGRGLIETFRRNSQ